MGANTMTGWAVGAPAVAGCHTTDSLAGGGTGGCVITCKGAGLANGGDKTAATPWDGFARGMGVYPGPSMVPSTPRTQVP